MNNLSQPSRLKRGLESVLPIVLILIFSYLFRLQFGSWLNADWHVVLYSRFIFWFIVLLLLIYANKINHEPFLLWEEQSYPVSFYFSSVIVMYLLVILSGIISAIPIMLGMHDNNTIVLKMMRLINQSIWVAVFGAITAGITEEYIMRGFMLPRMQYVFNSKVAAVLISSLLFSLLHYQYHSIREIIGTFLIGIIFAVHYQKYRNIKIVMIAHFMVDFIAFMIGRANIK